MTRGRIKEELTWGVATLLAALLCAALLPLLLPLLLAERLGGARRRPSVEGGLPRAPGGLRTRP